MSNSSPWMMVLTIVSILILLSIFLCLITKYGRNLVYTEEVTKGIKSDTPFPSPINSSNNSKHSNYRYMNTSKSMNSKSNSTFDSPNEPLYIPNDLENAYIVRKEYVPKSVDELPIKKYQILSVKEIYEDGWCMASSINSGEMGVVPLQCLYKYSDYLKKKQKQKQYAQQFPKNERQIPKIVIN
ncbi:hypothetical protein BCR32DRAFT_293763 [Anaeromyces robustus]|uniref:SH3 domain-containing protein n=1 Tax=Anaeromyces robustus TaxID=1754192 RepID=A0A1Y1X448_9FUNG|nr:hypothetical protein BCR32DRAFT_293763 [Anaeromyces robustus]|eukprot:ORX80579.1 hypothetical protein BCR32DRAFT_293763 [Anaeromyces robustus]